MKILFDEIPYLENENIILKRLEEEDRTGLPELTGSEEVYRYLPTFLLEKQYSDMRLMLEDFYGSCPCSGEQ